MIKKGIGAAAIGLLCLAGAITHGDSSEIGFAPGQSMDVKEFLSQARASSAADAKFIRAGYAAGGERRAMSPGRPVEWVAIGGGTFVMGADDGFDNTPAHAVTIKAFEMSRTPVTVEQYAECVGAGRCPEPHPDSDCNWGKADRRRHPMNCVNWTAAVEFAKFKGARLPTESEWEYAATSGGKNQKYPWGSEVATCGRAVMYEKGYGGCGGRGTLPVCSTPAGNTDQGLCDMAGNVWQWVQDKYRRSYHGAPADGSAVEAPGLYRVLRGGSFDTGIADSLRADYRNLSLPGDDDDDFGFRLARSNP